ncbi:hypothetical protein ACFLQ3_01565 [Bacteroidota bacterium]
MRNCKTSFTNIKESIAFLMFITVVSCNVSPLSHKDITRLNELGANIIIQQDPYNEKTNNISLMLFDKKGKQVGNENIKIRVNNQELPLSIIQELYYTKKIRYLGYNIPISDSYYFEIELPKDSIFPLAFIKAIPIINIKNIKLAEEGTIDLETKIEWKEMKDFDKIRIWKSYKINGENSYGGGPYALSTIKKKIKQNGNCIVPKSFYKDSISTITSLYLEFHASKKGLINHELLVGSNVTLNSIAVKRIEINMELTNANNK